MLYSYSHRKTLPYCSDENIEKSWRITENLFQVRYQSMPVSKETKELVQQWRAGNQFYLLEIWQQAAQKCAEEKISKAADECLEQLELLCMTMEEMRRKYGELKEIRMHVVEKFLKNVISILETRESVS